MSLPWIKLHSRLPTHRKSLELGSILRRSRAWTYVVELWLWTSRECPDGSLHGLSDRTIAEAAGWSGNAAQFVNALRTVGFLDEDGSVHDWDEHAEAHVAFAAERAESAAEDREDRKRRLARERAARARSKRDDGVTPSVTRHAGERDERDESVTRHAAQRDAERDESVTKTRSDGLSARAKTEIQIQTEIEDSKSTPRGPPSAAADPVAAGPVAGPGRPRKRSTSLVAAVPDGPVGEVWRHYVATVSPQARFTVDRQRLIDRALTAYGVEDLKRTIGGYARSPHHNGQNDRGEKYLSLELFLRDSKHIEAGWAYLTAAPSPGRASSPSFGINDAYGVGLPDAYQSPLEAA